MTTAEAGKRRTTLLLSALVLAMFGLGFAMAPLYNLFCQVTGIQSISQRQALSTAPASDSIDDNRQVTIKFDSTVQPNLPWQFTPPPQALRINPGRSYDVNFVARNTSSQTVTAHAIPSVTPWQATRYLHKVQCFCFNRQTLDGGERADMPLRFVLSTELPPEIRSITLSYNLLRSPDAAQQPLANRKPAGLVAQLPQLAGGDNQ